MNPTPAAVPSDPAAWFTAALRDLWRFARGIGNGVFVGLLGWDIARRLFDAEGYHPNALFIGMFLWMASPVAMGAVARLGWRTLGRSGTRDFIGLAALTGVALAYLFASLTRGDVSGFAAVFTIYWGMTLAAAGVGYYLARE